MNNETNRNPHNRIDVTGVIRNGKPQVREFQSKPLKGERQNQFTYLCLTQQTGGDYPEALENSKIIIKHSI